MKTAEEWVKTHFNDLDCQVESDIRQIQLDAMKEGARRAARIADTAQYKTEPRDCMIAILTTAEQWTEKDL